MISYMCDYDAVNISARLSFQTTSATTFIVACCCRRVYQRQACTVWNRIYLVRMANLTGASSEIHVGMGTWTDRHSAFVEIVYVVESLTSRR